MADFDLYLAETSVFFDEAVLTSGFEWVRGTGMFGFEVLVRLLPAERGFGSETAVDGFFWLLSCATTSFD